jgi:hypothetical protein
MSHETPPVPENTATKIEVTPTRFGHWVRVTIGVIQYGPDGGPAWVFGSQERAIKKGHRLLAHYTRTQRARAQRIIIPGVFEPAEYVPAPATPPADVPNGGIGNSSRAYGEMIVRVAKALCAAQNGQGVWDLLEPWGRTYWISEAADIVTDPADAQWGETS